MRVATYNQCFALNARRFISCVKGHWAVHYQNKKSRVWELTDLKRTLNIIRKSKADIISICEVLGGQENELTSGLKKLGYKYIFFADGHHTKFNHIPIRICLASKLRCRHVRMEKEPLLNKFGGGGGSITCYFPKLKLDVIAVHLGLLEDIRHKQLALLEKEFNKNHKFIFLGDFNTGYEEVKDHFKKLTLITGRLKTCSLTPIIRLFYWKDVDHILVKGFKKITTGFLEGFSDHRLVHADLK